MPDQEAPREHRGQADEPIEESFALDEAAPEQNDDTTVDGVSNHLTGGDGETTDDLHDEAAWEDAAADEPGADALADELTEVRLEPDFEAQTELEVPPLEDIEDALDDPEGDRVPPLILVSAVIGLVVGLFVWGSLAISVISSTGGVVGDLTDSENAFGQELEQLARECSEDEMPGFLTAEQRASILSQCASPTPEVVETPAPDPALNREDCDAIRGTDYRSVEEREWFLENCVEG